MLYPYVKECIQLQQSASVEGFIKWKDEKVHSPTFLSAYNIERNFGTSLLLFQSSYRANNLKLLKVAQRQFSSLFHINNNSMYLKLDMFTQYLELKMQKENPNLANYLKDKMFCNTSGKKYCAEPYDEKHEEYNRQGMRFQANRDENEMENSFTCVQAFGEMKESVYKDLGLKNKYENRWKKPNYEPNILDMRMHMRSQEYLSDINSESLVSLEGEPLDKTILDIKTTAQKVRKQNVLQAMNESSFFGTFQCRKLDFTKNDKVDIDISEQARILIAAVEDDASRMDIFKFWENQRKNEDFNEHEFVDNLISGRFNLNGVGE